MRLPGSRSREEAQASGNSHMSSRTDVFPPERLYFSAEGRNLRIAVPGGRDYAVSRELTAGVLEEYFLSERHTRLFTAETLAAMLNELLLSGESDLVSVTVRGERVVRIRRREEGGEFRALNSEF